MREPLFSLVSAAWSTVSGSARYLADRGILKRTRFNSRVISVGNLQAGGSGKTPLVALIANEALQKGMKVGILTRGYKSRWEATGGVLLPREEIDPEFCGDEAALLRELCPGAYIGVGADRVLQYGEVLKKAGLARLDLVILDDGFQNWKIHKDLEIVAVTSAKPSQTFFRDRWEALKHADLVVWTKGEVGIENPGKPWVHVRYQLPKYEGSAPLWLVTGLADNAFAYQLAVESGYPVRRHVPREDHAEYDREMVQKFLDQARAEGCKIAVTGKDWVKWKRLGASSEQVLVLEPKLVFETGQEVWSEVLWK